MTNLTEIEALIADAKRWQQEANACAMTHARLLANRAEIKARLVEAGLSAKAANELLPKQYLDPDFAEIPSRTQPLDEIDRAALLGNDGELISDDDLEIPAILRREP